jgi:ribosomal-protein-alanine N-acetyltransferase
MATPYGIRAAEPGDAPRIAALERECFPDPWSPAGVKEALSLATGLGLVAEVAGLVEGYILTRWVADTAEILNLAVTPDHRRAGIASALLGEALRELERRGVGDVFLEVRQSNRPAQALYRDWGFRVAGMRPAYYRRPVEDALVLRRALGEGA